MHALIRLMPTIIAIALMSAPLPASELAAAIASMRGIKSQELDGPAQKAKAKELDKAWTTIKAAGPAGIAELKKELKHLEAIGERDDFFRLGASRLLWEIGALNEAGTIATIWSGPADLTVNYHYVFYTAFEAARTQDQRALPMLVTLMRDRKGRAFQAQHSLTISFPLNHVFLWGAFGPSGYPELRKQLDSPDESTSAIAILLLARAQDLKSLPVIRRIAKTGSGLAKREAIKALGQFGHPDDFGFLARGLDLADNPMLWEFAYAAYEFEDLRLVPKLVPHAMSEDANLKMEVLATLLHLPTKEGLTAWRKAYVSMNDGNTKSSLLARLPGEWTQSRLQAATEADIRVLAESLREREAARFKSKPEDQKLDQPTFQRAAKDWQKAGRITGGEFPWIEERHVISAATPEDIPLLQSAAAACYLRLSDECLYETETIEALVRWLGRSRHRTEPGVCNQASSPISASFTRSCSGEWN